MMSQIVTSLGFCFRNQFAGLRLVSCTSGCLFKSSFTIGRTYLGSILILLSLVIERERGGKRVIILKNYYFIVIVFSWMLNKHGRSFKTFVGKNPIQIGFVKYYK